MTVTWSYWEISPINKSVVGRWGSGLSRVFMDTSSLKEKIFQSHEILIQNFNTSIN